jgi:hypothetical protein
LLDAPNWDYTAENRLLFERDHSTRFYRWVQRWLHQEWHMARLRHGQEQASPTKWMRRLGGLWASRVLVHLHRTLPADSV